MSAFGSPEAEQAAMAEFASMLAQPAPQPTFIDKLLQTWPAKLAQSAYSAVTLPGEVLRNRDTAMDVLSGARNMSQETFNRATDLASIPMVATTGAPAGALGAGPVRPGIRAYHGSPHDFDRFDLSRIGTGEGAQAYGRGLYFAENEAVARGYRDILTSGATSPEMTAAKVLQLYGGDADRALAHVQRNMHSFTGPDDLERSLAIQRALITPERLPSPQGRMYEVNINTTPERLLDWDAPLRSQPEGVRRALGWTPADESAYRSMIARETDDILAALSDSSAPVPRGVDRDLRALQAGRPSLEATGEQIYRDMTARAGDTWLNPNRQGADRVVDELRERGLDGIRYYDQGSRALTGGEILGVEQGPRGWLAKVRVENRGGTAFDTPTQSITTSRPYATREEAEQWARQATERGTRNYVMFDDALVEILRKYGLAGLTAGGAVAASSGQSDAGNLVGALVEASDMYRGHGVE